MWTEFKSDEVELKDVVEQVLSNKNFWDRDLTEISGLAGQVEKYLQQIRNKGMKEFLKKVLKVEDE